MREKLNIRFSSSPLSFSPRKMPDLAPLLQHWLSVRPSVRLRPGVAQNCGPIPQLPPLTRWKRGNRQRKDGHRNGGM